MTRSFFPLLALLLPALGFAQEAAPAMPGKNVPAIKVNTVGYPSGWRKTVVLNVPPEKGKVLLKSLDGKAPLVLGEAKARGLDLASKDPVWDLDLPSDLPPGRYQVESGKSRSDPFEVGEVAALYATALKASLKHFYFQRCRTELKEPYAKWEGESFARAGTCHAHGEVGWDLTQHPAKANRQAPPKGWHDAGNYDMYVPSTAPTAQALLRAYEGSPSLFKDGDLTIPESGNGIPDILDETAWGLRWVLWMQMPDGGVRHRDAVMEWSATVPPDQELAPRWIAGVGTASTAKACALFAQAARIYGPFDKTLAEECRKAAQKAWEFLRKNPTHLAVDAKGSPQPLWDDAAANTEETGARLNAAVEMWRTFGKDALLPYIRGLMAKPQAQPADFVKGAWVNLARWPIMHLAMDKKVPADLREEAASRVLEAARILRARVEKDDLYRCATEPGGYYWGHNSNLMEKTDILLAAADLVPSDPGFLEAARDQWHWLLGRNPNGFSMVTRVGKGPTALYHLEWGKLSSLPPGYLVGGPNHQSASFLSPDAPAKALLWDNPMALRSGLAPGALWHSQQSDLWEGGFVPSNQWSVGWWTVTEPDIYYNANLVLVAARMQR